MARNVDISQVSWLIHTDLVEVDTVTFWAKSSIPVIEENETDSIYTVKTHDRFDNLSHTFYSSPRQWWLIARANGMFLAPIELLPARDIRIPSITRLRNDGIV